MKNLKILFLVSAFASIVFISIHKSMDRNKLSTEKKQGETWAEVIYLIYIYSYAKHFNPGPNTKTASAPRCVPPVWLKLLLQENPTRKVFLLSTV